MIELMEIRGIEMSGDRRSAAQNKIFSARFYDFDKLSLRREITNSSNELLSHLFGSLCSRGTSEGIVQLSFAERWNCLHVQIFPEQTRNSFRSRRLLRSLSSYSAWHF